MENVLKLKILTFVLSNNLSISVFEKKFNFKRNAIQSITSEKIQNPTLDTLVRLADSLECSIDELIGREKFIYEGEELKIELMTSILDSILKFLKEHKCTTLTTAKFYKAFETIYDYCIQNKLTENDKNFTEWCLKNFLKAK